MATGRIPVTLTNVHGESQVYQINMGEYTGERFEFWAQAGVHGTVRQTSIVNVSHETTYVFHPQNPFHYDANFPVGVYHFQDTQVYVSEERRTEFSCRVRWMNSDNILIDYAREDWDIISATARSIRVTPLGFPEGENDNDGGDDDGPEDGNGPNGDELLLYEPLPLENGHMERGLEPEILVDVAENGFLHHRAPNRIVRAVRREDVEVTGHETQRCRRSGGLLATEAGGEGGLNEGEVPSESEVDVVHVEVLAVDEAEVFDVVGEVDEDFGLAWLFDVVTGVAGTEVDEDYFVVESGSLLAIEAGGGGGLNEGEVPRDGGTEVVHVEIPEMVAVDEVEVLDEVGEVDEDFGLAWLFDEVTGVAGGSGLSLLGTGGEGSLDEEEVAKGSFVDVEVPMKVGEGVVEDKRGFLRSPRRGRVLSMVMAGLMRNLGSSSG